MNSNNYQVVFQGLDTLHIVYIGYLDPDWWESSELKVKKRKAQERKEVPYVKIGSDSWEVSPKGNQEYVYCLMRNGWRVYVSSARGTKPIFNQLKIEIPSSRLRLGLEDLDKEFRAIAFCVLSLGGERVQRVDITADVSGFPMNDLNAYHFYGFPTKMKSINSDLMLEKFYSLGKESDLETVVVGKNPQLRIYDKKKLAIQQDPDWFQCWYDKSYEEVLDMYEGDTNQIPEITRFEFQLRAYTLREFQINSYDDLMEKIQGLWDYMGNKWMELKIDDPNIKVKRKLPVAPIWTFMRTLKFNGNLKLKRIKPFGKDSSKNFEQIMGHFSSFLAKEKIDLSGRDEEQFKSQLAEIFVIKFLNSNKWDWEKFMSAFRQKKNQFGGI
ncbi:MAG: hypothetical protein HOJ79_07720 [Nitrospina sp.]|nr:hypothetical protein [Nitrospina sp.]